MFVIVHKGGYKKCVLNMEHSDQDSFSTSSSSSSSISISSPSSSSSSSSSTSTLLNLSPLPSPGLSPVPHSRTDYFHGYDTDDLITVKGTMDVTLLIIITHRLCLSKNNDN